MKGMPPAWAATPSTQASPTITMCLASGQRSRTTRSPSGSGLRAVTSSRVTTRSRWRSRSKRESTKSATTRSLLVQIAVTKPSWRSASSASAAWGSSTACSMAPRSCAWGMARISASRCGACARTWPKISAPDHRNSRTGSAIPRSRTKTSISRPTALRSRGELTRVWSRSKTQTGGCAVTASGAMGGGPWFHVQQEVAQELDAAAIEGAVGHDQLDVLGQAWPDAFGGLLRAHDRARALQHAIERPRIVGGGEDRRDVEQPRRLHGPEEILAARRGGADEAHGGTLRQFREAQERLDAGLGEEGDHGRAVHGHAALHLMNVKEGGDDDAIALEEAGIAPGLGVEFLHQHAIHVERQLRLELIAVARQLGVVAFDEHGPLPDRLGHLPGGPARGEGGHELVLGEAQATGPGEALADQTGQAVGRAPLSRGPIGYEGAAALVPLDVAVPLEIGESTAHGVRIDAEKARELAHGRELHAGLQRPRRDQVPDLGHKLHVHGHSALPVHPEPRRGRDSAALTRHGARRSLVADWRCSWGPGLLATGPA